MAVAGNNTLLTAVNEAVSGNKTLINELMSSVHFINNDSVEHEEKMRDVATEICGKFDTFLKKLKFSEQVIDKTLSKDRRKLEISRKTF